MAGVRMTQEEYDAIVKRQKAAAARSASLSSANMEPASCLSPVATEKNTRLDSPSGHFDLRVISERHRLCDADGISAKAVIDGFVHAGVFANDSPEIIHKVEYAQDKIGKELSERTIIEIWG